MCWLRPRAATHRERAPHLRPQPAGRPLGEVLAVQAEGEGVVMGSLERTRIDRVRRQLPALDHRV